jgi:hypothetical protein
LVTHVTLNRLDKDFRHEGISYIDFKQLEMDRVLSGLLPRLWWDGRRSVIQRTHDVSTEDFTATIAEHPEMFEGFDHAVTTQWVETHLLDMVNRGKATQAVAGLRPLHGFTYRFRNTKRSRAYNADEQIYEMLGHTSDNKGTLALRDLKNFFFAGVDVPTQAPRPGADIDVETQALISLSDAVQNQISDRAATDRDHRSYPPLYQEAADLLADDVLRLLAHRALIPRTVLVEYLKILLAFHLALYHLNIVKLLPTLVRGERNAAADGGFFLDVTGLPGSGPARLAERSAALWYGRIPGFVRAAFTVKKLDDFAEYMFKRGVPRPPGGFFQVRDLLGLLGPNRREERLRYAGGRLSAIEDARDREAEDPEYDQILQLGTDEFTTYVEVVTHFRVRFHRKYLTECLDTLLLKNRPGSMIAQPRGGHRRFVLDSRLLEVLLQLSLLGVTRHGTFETRSLRIDEFLDLLRDRYGLHIDRLPDGDGFGPAIVTDHAALRHNRAAFVARLREIGFYSELSDAYLTQTITPRYTISPNTSTGNPNTNTGTSGAGT